MWDIINRAASQDASAATEEALSPERDGPDLPPELDTLVYDEAVVFHARDLSDGSAVPWLQADQTDVVDLQEVR